MTAPIEQAVEVRRNRWHQSTLSSLIDGCAFQYYLIYIEGLDQGPKEFAAVGTAYHAIVEVQENLRMLGEKEPDLANMKEAGRQYLSVTTTNPEMLDRLDAALENYEEHIRPYLKNFHPLALEPEFTLPLVDGAKPVGGYIDGVYQDPATGQVFVIDHKTVKDFSRWRNPDGHRRQAAMYAAALVLDERFPDIQELPEMRYLLVRTSRGSRSNFEKSRVMRVQPDLVDVSELGDRVRQAEAIVASGVFPRNREWGLCHKSWCNFYERCVTTGELPAQYQVSGEELDDQNQIQAQQEGAQNV